LPLVIAAAAIAVLAVDESRDQSAGARQIDLAGAALAAVGLGGVSFALVQGPDLGWWNPGTVTAAGIGMVGLVGFLFWELRAPSPLLPMRLFRSRNLTAANAATLALYAVFNGNFFVLTIYLQTALGYSPLAAGAATLPVTLLMIFLASRLGRWSSRIGPRLPMTVGILLTAAGLGLLAFVRPADAYFLRVLPGVVVFGLGLALTVPPLTNTAISSVADSEAGIASGVNDEVARVAALLGVAVCGLAFGTWGYAAAMATGVAIAVAGAVVAFLVVKVPGRIHSRPQARQA
jgi:predicted MFS family arabinose efflux permease